MKMLYNEWKDIDWVLVRFKVFKWQQEIYLASKLDDTKLVRKFQHRLIGSIEAKLLAVQMVTQDSMGKKILGIDRINWIPPENRLTLALSLKVPAAVSHVCRHIITNYRGKIEIRKLIIPTIEDQCLQTIFKLALEPEWEAKFEHNSFGFRPGRNCHDAISAVRSFIQKRSNYVLVASITKCFKRINHEKLLDKIGMTGKYCKQLRMWLKYGVLDQSVFSQTKYCILEGSVISSLLVNIVLNGMENFCKNLISDIPVPAAKLVKPSRRCETLGFIRYAEDFLVIHPDLEVIVLIHQKLPEFLASIGLELSHNKTSITHTLEISEDTKQICTGFNGNPGFNFLGFYIRQHKTVHSSNIGPIKELLGFRTIVIPSKEKCKTHQKKLHNLILKSGKALSQDMLVMKLNHVIRGWSNYFGRSDANSTGVLGQMDYLLYLKLRRWAKRIYKTTKKGRKVFRRIGNSKWKFSTNKSVLVQHKDFSYPLSKYIKVKAWSSPFDQAQPFRSSRLFSDRTYITPITLLVKKQKGYCPRCKTLFKYDDVLQVNRIISRAKSGEHFYANFQVLHSHCHDIKTTLY